MRTTRFFMTVGGPPLTFVLCAAAVVGFGAYIAANSPRDFDQTLGILLVLQAFAASTGFRAPLRRGHFDPALDAGSASLSVAGAHWLVSVGLGMAAWAILGIEAFASNRNGEATAFTASGLAAIAYVSTAAWAVSLGIGRYAGGVLWMLLVIAFAVLRHLQTLQASLTTPADTWLAAFRTIEAVLVFPLFLLFDAPARSAKIVIAVFAATLLAWLAGAFQVARFDRALVDD